MKTGKFKALIERDPIYCQVQRNAIWFHRNQMRFLSAHGPQSSKVKLMRSHAAEIKQIYQELEEAADRLAIGLR